MTKTAFQVKTQEDYTALLEELKLFGYEYIHGGNGGADYWKVYGQDTVVYAETESTHLMYGSADFFELNNLEETLHVFKKGMRLSLDATGFHIDASVACEDIAEVTPRNADAVATSVQHMMSEYGVKTVAEGIEQWLKFNGFDKLDNPEPQSEPEEPKYTVVLPNPNTHSRAQLIVLRKQHEDPTSDLQLSKIKQLNFINGKPSIYHLTEAEIKKDFEWAWQFAEEVK